MNTPLLLIAECLLSLAFSLLTLRLLNPSLLALLERLCPDRAAAGFWQRYTQLMLSIAPLLCVLFLDVFVNTPDPLARLRWGLIAGLGGLLYGLWLIGSRLGHFIEAAERHALLRCDGSAA